MLTLRSKNVFLITLLLAILALVAPSSRGPVLALDTSMLVEHTPHTDADLSGADPVALAYLAKGWLIANDRPRADRLLDELERRGTAAFGMGRAHTYFPPVRAEPNPADTIYTITLVQVADAFRAFGRRDALAGATRELDAIPMAGEPSLACWAYSAADVGAGCVHNINAITAAFLSRIGRNVNREIAFERETMVEPGAWYYWREAPPGYWAHKKIEDAGHLGWSAFEMMRTEDTRLIDLGRLAARYVSRTYVESAQPYFAYFAVAAAKVAAGIEGGCEMARALPDWATRNSASDPTRKARQWAAFVHVWTQKQCADN